MKVAVFSAKRYDRDFLDAANASAGHQLTYFDVDLHLETAAARPPGTTPPASSSTTRLIPRCS